MLNEFEIGIIFDLDGVLIDSEEVMSQAFTEAFKLYFPNQEAPVKEFLRKTGEGFKNILQALDLPEELGEVFLKISSQNLSRIRIFNGIKNLLESLHKCNSYLGIATGKERKRTESILHLVGLSKFFHQVVCGDEVRNTKPHRESIDFHINKSNLDTSKIFFVGDSISDIRCAKNAEVSSIAALWGIGRLDDLLSEKPTYIAYEVQHLCQIFEDFGVFNSQRRVP